VEDRSSQTVEVTVTDSMTDSTAKHSQQGPKSEGIRFAYLNGTRIEAQDDNAGLDFGVYEYKISLSCSPADPVKIDLLDLKNKENTVHPAVLVFGRGDWHTGKRVRISPPQQNAVIRHRLSSKDLRLHDLESFILVPAMNNNDLAERTSSSSLNPAVFLFPKRSAGTTVPPAVLSNSGITLSVSDYRVSFAPRTFDQLQLDQGVLTFWVDKDPGHSFSCVFQISHVFQLAIHYVSRIPAVVVSKERFVSKQDLSYMISLSLPILHPVSVRVSTSTTSVCLDNDAEFSRPCNETCARCDFTSSQVRLDLPDQFVTFHPVLNDLPVPIRVRVLGLANSGYFEKPPLPTSSVFVMHQVVQENAVGLFTQDTPTVFGPFDSEIKGVELPFALMDTLPAPTAVLALVTKTKWPNKFKVRLNYIPRSPVEVEEGRCRALTLSKNQMEGNVVCTVGDVALVFTLHSTDPDFNGVVVSYANTPKPTQAAQFTKMIKLGFGGLTVLATFVSLLFVWVFFGPEAMQLQEQQQTRRKLTTITNILNEDLKNEFRSLPESDALHEFDVVIVHVLEEGGYFLGRVVGTEDVLTGCYSVAFFDGQSDSQVRPNCIKKRKLAREAAKQFEVILERQGASVGLLLGWTTRHRAVVTGLEVNSPAFRVALISVGDFVVAVNDRDDFTSLAELMRLFAASVEPVKVRLQSL
jgi:hypothetical protein